MDILQINKYYYPKGGSERYFFSLSEELEKRGHRVIPFSMKHPGNAPTPYEDYFVDEQDYYEHAAPWEKATRALSFIRSRQAAENVRRLIEVYKPQIAHLHNIYHQITPSVIPVLLDAGVKVVMTLHDYKLVCPNYSMYTRGEFCFRCKNGVYLHAPLTRCHYGSFWRSALLAVEASWQRLTRVYHRAHLLITPSEFMRDRLIEGGFDPARIVFVPAYMPWDASDDSAGETAARGEAVAAAGPARVLPAKYLLFFGRMSEEKGVHILLEAMREMPEVPLVLCGDGPLVPFLKGYVERHALKDVIFTGHLDKRELEAIIKGAYAVVLPSLFPENAPFTMLESAALGTPVIASDVGGLPEMIQRLGGVLFEHGSAHDLAGKIETLWDNEEERNRLSEYGLQAAKREYNLETHLQRIEQIYLTLIGN